MIKKMILLFLSFLFLSAVACAEDQHYQMMFTVHHPENQTEITADLVLHDGEATLSSEIFPSYSIAFPAPHEPELRLPSFSVDDFRILPEEILGVFDTETFTGVYSGDLFDDARLMEAGSVRIREVVPVLIRLAEALTETVLQSDLDPEGEIEAFADQLDFSGFRFDYSSFDSGRYYSFTAADEDQTFFTASFDFSEANRVRALIGNAENGINFFRILDVDILSENEIQLRLTVLPDTMKAGYRSAMHNAPTLTENLSVKITEDRHSMFFTGEIIPGDSDKTSVHLDGSLFAGETVSFEAKIVFGDAEDSWISFSFRPDNRPVKEKETRILTLQDLESPENVELFSEEAGRSLFPVFMNIVQILPTEYLEAILEIVY